MRYAVLAFPSIHETELGQTATISDDNSQAELEQTFGFCVVQVINNLRRSNFHIADPDKRLEITVRVIPIN